MNRSLRFLVTVLFTSGAFGLPKSYAATDADSCSTSLLIDQTMPENLPSVIRYEFFKLADQIKELDQEIEKLPAPGLWPFKKTVLRWPYEFAPLHKRYASLHNSVYFWWNKETFWEAMKSRPDVAIRLISIISDRLDKLAERRIVGRQIFAEVDFEDELRLTRERLQELEIFYKLQLTDPGRT